MKITQRQRGVIEKKKETRRKRKKKKKKKTHGFRSTGLAEPTLFGDVVNLERRFEAAEMERAQAPAFAAEEVTFAAARVTVIIVGLHKERDLCRFERPLRVTCVGV